MPKVGGVLGSCLHVNSIGMVVLYGLMLGFEVMQILGVISTSGLYSMLKTSSLLSRETSILFRK